ncbi:alpha,alpha-trehalase TreA [Gluconacetobacter takamatsuzukensis]|uniref:Alpha,alpha-trehalase TreA n=1 Tax=Gluconacetobacter takamatsuzukensis TaxID=1286190 RepID=A0A7W4KBU5_9PROT|nr:alpha,alpha-trehalase TreA [Gluconacetobacter takamatsuzukensis]
MAEVPVAAPAPAAAPVSAPAASVPDLLPPSIALDGLFAAISAAHIFADAKTAADAVPDRAPGDLLATYEQAKGQSGFDLNSFVAQHFSVPQQRLVSYRRHQDESVREYIDGMWDVLSRPPDRPPAYASLLPLPEAYVVPGGRFRELYYWDSYFTLIGLSETGRFDLLRGTVRDIASLIDGYGHMPNGSRTYYLSRSEPPFFALMVDLLARHDGPQTYVTFLPELQREYAYWMEGEDGLAPGTAHRRVVRLADGTVMNRHWDDRDTPRDESYPQDIATAAASDRPAAEIYRNLRAGAESGWDYSSRWLADGHTLTTIHTVDLLPVDLNSLIAHLQQTLAHAYEVRGDQAQAQHYAQLATERIAAIRRVSWDPAQGAFFDYDWTKRALSPVLSTATLVPLFLEVATPDQARMVAATVRARLLRAGGLVTTELATGQQWDAPNGWAPEEWMAIMGLARYGEDELAREIAARWMARVVTTYQQSGVLLEKYDVVNPSISPMGGAGGGEYPMQIGFGWTNGTLLGLMNRYPAATPPSVAPSAVNPPPAAAGPAVPPPAAGSPAAPVPVAPPVVPASDAADAAKPVQGHDGDGQQNGAPGLVHGAGPGGHDQQQGGDAQGVLDQNRPAQ